MINCSAENAGEKQCDYSCCLEQIINLSFAAEQTGGNRWLGFYRGQEL